jgi:SAM-dependent methyltransferase
MKDFDHLYDETINDLRLALKELDLSIFCRHNRGFQFYQNTENLVNAFFEEKKRYQKSFEFILSLQKQRNPHSILDVGCLFGILPTILRKALVNIEIHVIDNFSFYGNTLDSIKRILQSHDIEVHDVDIMQGIPFSDNHFSLVTLLAVVEHFSISPINLLIEIKRILQNEGCLIVDTPNVCSMTRRISFLLRGIPPYPRLEDFLFSETPFTGHCREYSEKDLSKLLKYSGFEIKTMALFNIGTFKNMNLRSLILQRFIPWIFPGLRNYIWCTAKPKK